ncbi:MAG: nucleotidyltransferase [Bryobacterales bacterium]|nr:nucleotidyltransferase [Bryobacterales bacterium]
MNFELAIQRLCDAGVKFVVIGGWAAIFHGSAHVTNDLDICYSRDRENLGKLATALAPYHPRPREFPDDLPFVWDAATLANGTVFTLTTDLGIIDLLAEVSGIGTYDEAYAASVEVDAFGRRLRALDLRALIQAKKAAGRRKDLLTLPELEGLLEAEQNE